MTWSSKHISWLDKIEEDLKTSDGKVVEVFEFKHQEDSQILSEWALHFRNHYCPDTLIDALRGDRTRKDYLNEIKFPSQSKPGPSIRAGDFGEILVADYLQWKLNYEVPRLRWGSKSIRNESTKGCDVIGFQIYKEGKTSKEDLLAIYEAKTKFSKTTKNRLQDAINSSAKDNIRIVETLNYLKQRLIETNQNDQAKKIERFENPTDHPYKEVYGAALIVTNEHYESSDIISATTTGTPSHPRHENLALIVIKGNQMMNLVNELYRRAADEA